MKYRTDLMDQIVKSESGKLALDIVPPMYGDDYVSLCLFQSNGEVLDKVSKWVDEYKAQIVPQTATWGLIYWESEYGLPINPPGLTVEQRRGRVLAKMWSNGQINPAKLEQILSNLFGVPATIKENTGKNKFSILITSRPHLTDEAAVRKKVNVLKPAHLIYDVGYQNAVSTDVYVGGVIQKFKIINLKEV